MDGSRVQQGGVTPFTVGVLWGCEDRTEALKLCSEEVHACVIKKAISEPVLAVDRDGAALFSLRT